MILTSQDIARFHDALVDCVLNLERISEAADALAQTTKAVQTHMIELRKRHDPPQKG